MTDHPPWSHNARRPPTPRPTHTWRDFLIHIATIVVGLLIAIGLEQSVEFFHHRHQVAETREALRHEREENVQRYAINVAFLRRMQAILVNNRLVLRSVQDHPGGTNASLPGVIVCRISRAIVMDGVWRSAQQSGVVDYMPQTEVQRNERLYRLLKEGETAQALAENDLSEACQALQFNPDPAHLNAQQVESMMTALETTELKLSGWADGLRNLHAVYPEFSDAPTEDDLRSVISLTPQRQAAIDEATRMTQQRIDATAGPDPLTRLLSH